MSCWKTKYCEPYETRIPPETHDLAYKEFRRHESFLGRLVTGVITRIQNRIQTPITEKRVIRLPFIGAQLTYSIRCERPIRLVRCSRLRKWSRVQVPPPAQIDPTA